MSKHTPGPWRMAIGLTGVVSILSHGDTTVATAAARPGAADNARLIASAPDLLTICEQTADALESDDPDLSLYWLAEQLRKATAKARGEEE